MSELERITQRIPDFAKDIRLNLASVIDSEGALSREQRLGVAVASAAAARNAELLAALVAETTAGEGGAARADDALAAAALMAMNNVYYRFRHQIAKESYSRKPARLRMNRLVKPLTSKLDFELYCLAVSAINGCEACVRAHEKTVVDGGLSEDAVHDAVRIAAVVHAAAVAMESGAAAGIALIAAA